MTDRVEPNRRNFLTGHYTPRTIHISSAVVVTFPARADDLAARLERLPGTEVRHVENGKLVIVMEAATSGELGGRLAEISGMDGVLAANMVFEQILDDGDAA